VKINHIKINHIKRITRAGDGDIGLVDNVVGTTFKLKNYS